MCQVANCRPIIRFQPQCKKERVEMNKQNLNKEKRRQLLFIRDTFIQFGLLDVNSLLSKHGVDASLSFSLHFSENNNTY